MTRGSFDIVTEDASQLRDRARQHVVADEGVGPDRPHQAFFGHDLTGLRSKAHQHLHDLRFQASGAGGARHAVERRLDMMEFADAKAVLQRFAQCAKRTSRFYSTDSARLPCHVIHRLQPNSPFSKSNCTRWQPSDSTPSTPSMLGGYRRAVSGSRATGAAVGLRSADRGTWSAESGQACRRPGRTASSPNARRISCALWGCGRAVKKHGHPSR